MPKTSTERVWEFRARQRERQQQYGQQRQRGGYRRGAGRPRGTKNGVRPNINRSLTGNIMSETEPQDLCFIPGCGKSMKPICRLPSGVQWHPQLEPRTYCRKVKVKPEGNLEKKEPLKSHAEIEISNRTETFACPSIKEESIDLKEETELHKINEENVCIESDIFGKNASFKLTNYDFEAHIVVNEMKKEEIDIEIKEESIDRDAETELHKIDEENVGIESKRFSENVPLKLPSYDHQTQPVVNKIKKNRIDFKIKEESIDLETENELHKIDEENVCVESDVFSEHVSLKLRSFNQKTRTVVKNLIDTIFFNAENGMYDNTPTPTSSSLC